MAGRALPRQKAEPVVVQSPHREEAEKYLHQVVSIEWDDAWSNAPWEELRDLDDDPPFCVSAGFLHAVTDRALVLVQTYTDQDAGHAIRIPLVAVKQILPLGPSPIQIPAKL